MGEYPKQLAPGVMVVGRFDPGTDINDSLIRSGVRSQIQGISISKSEDIRSPYENQIMRTNTIASNWHQDNNYSLETHGKGFAMVVWSNREQTEIRLLDGTETVIHPDPCDIVLIHNDKVLHRTPHIMSSDRWFFRSHLVAPEWL